MPHKDDGKFVVVQDGKRVSGTLHETQQAAQSEADKARQKQPVVEGQPGPKEGPKVAQNLLG